MVGEECELTVKTCGPKARQDTEAFSEDPSLFLQFSFVLLVHHAVLQCICLPLNILIITIPCAYPGSSSLIQSPNLTFHLSVCDTVQGTVSSSRIPPSFPPARQPCRCLSTGLSVLIFYCHPGLVRTLSLESQKSILM